jgi:hypothetical protein
MTLTAATGTSNIKAIPRFDPLTTASILREYSTKPTRRGIPYRLFAVGHRYLRAVWQKTWLGNPIGSNLASASCHAYLLIVLHWGGWKELASRRLGGCKEANIFFFDTSVWSLGRPSK